MAEKSITNAKTPNQIAKTARKVSGSTRKDRKAALKSVARNAAKTRIGAVLTKKADKAAADFWTGTPNSQKKAANMRTATYNASKATDSSASKAYNLGVKPKKIAKTISRAEYAVAKRQAKAQKVQGTKKK